MQPENEMSPVEEQLEYFQAWASSLAAALPQPLSQANVLSALQLLVTGLPSGRTEADLKTLFNDLAVIHSAAVAAGDPVSSVKLQREAALLQLRCSVEASNFLAFDGLSLHGVVLKVQRPKDYSPSIAVLLGPCQPNPAVVAAVRRACCVNTAQPKQPAGTAAGAVTAADHEHPSFAAVTASKAAVGPTHSSCSFAAAVRSGAHHGSGPIPCRVAAAPDNHHMLGYSSTAVGSAEAHTSACKAAANVAAAGGGGGGSRDQLQAADQCKQDEVFIGGLPSHWKAQQVKELLAPYGQLKSLSVAMDAATGKNKGYAFVVFATSAMVAEAIEELDCRVVEGKILAVQRATDGKATGSSGRESMTGSDIHALRDGGSCGQQQHMQQQPQLQRPAHRTSSSGGNLLLGTAGPATAAPVVAAGSGTAEAGLAAGTAAAAGAGAVPIPQQAGVAPAAAGEEGSTLGQRLLAAVAGSGSAAVVAAPGMKQYDVNELYIGDLPLSWDEDAVRRLLGRYGKIKYFTLRNGRDKNFAFCKYKDSSVVDAAIQGLHGKIVDGYFLNVRRAIEGKQQQQQQWATAGGSKQQQQQRTSYDSRASFDGRGSFDAGSRAAQLRLSLDQQLHSQQPQQPQQVLLLQKGTAAKGTPAGAMAAGFVRGAHVAPVAAASAAVTGASAQQQQVSHTEALRTGQTAGQQQIKAAPAAVVASAGGAAVAADVGTAAAAAAPGAVSVNAQLQQQCLEQPQQKEQEKDLGAVSAPEESQLQQATVKAAAAAPVTALTSHASAPAPEPQLQLPQTIPASQPQPPQPVGYRHQLHQQPQLLPVQHPFHQQQQQQHSLFLHHGPSASWGAPGEVPSGSRGCQNQQPRQSLLQTWDMLSPWSLFSHTAQ